MCYICCVCACVCGGGEAYRQVFCVCRSRGYMAGIQMSEGVHGCEKFVSH